MSIWVLFDLDGTLVDNSEGITKSTQFALDSYGYPNQPMETLKKFIGPPLHESFMEFYGFSKEQAFEAVDRYRVRYKEKGVYENRLYPGMKALLEALKEAGAKRVLPLNVSGPFHSPMMEAASQGLTEALEGVGFMELKIPYVTNVTGQYVRDTALTRGLLIQQVASGVRWQQSIEAMIADGVDTFVEIGPGRTLTGFLRKINRDVKGYNIRTYEEMHQVCETLL